MILNCSLKILETQFHTSVTGIVLTLPSTCIFEFFGLPNHQGAVKLSWSLHALCTVHTNTSTTFESAGYDYIHTIIFDHMLVPVSDTPILISSVENGALQRSNLLQAFHLEGWIENLQIHGTSPKGAGMIWQLAEGCKCVRGWGLKCFRS